MSIKSLPGSLGFQVLCSSVDSLSRSRFRYSQTPGEIRAVQLTSVSFNSLDVYSGGRSFTSLYFFAPIISFTFPKHKTFTSIFLSYIFHRVDICVCPTGGRSIPRVPITVSLVSGPFSSRNPRGLSSPVLFLLVPWSQTGLGPFRHQSLCNWSEPERFKINRSKEYLHRFF